ncbi:nitrilase-related carbon-nitrogen hydrolase [Paraburkholderia dipogonis]|uniref:nitrilase-related carbon-nitrogen hydrolase n=1 Tax=Paraburkholderia dipogonis TaxID=1211383 RepID=UPI0038B6C4D2
MSLVSRPGDAPHNVARIADCLALAAEKDIGLVVFPESCIGGYGSMAKLHRAELDALAEPLDGPSITVFDTAWGVRVGILIGGDNYLVENMRMTALMGATLLIAPHRSDGANRTGNCRTQPGSMEQSLRRWLPARAGDNGMFVVFSEGGAIDDPDQSSGAGMIIDPGGRMLAESSARDALISADLDSELIDASAGQQWLTARRPELYGLLTRPGHQATDFEPRSVSSRGAIALSFAQVSRNRPIR